MVLRRKQSDLAKAGFPAYCRLDVYAPGLDGGKERGPGILPASCRGSKTPEVCLGRQEQRRSYRNSCYWAMETTERNGASGSHRDKTVAISGKPWRQMTDNQQARPYLCSRNVHTAAGQKGHTASLPLLPPA